MFQFTDKAEGLNSSLVKAAYYNEPRRELLVRLNGDKQYRYSNVSRKEFTDIVNARSKGAAYNSFRRWRGRGNGGTPATGEIVAKAGGVVTSTTSSAPAYDAKQRNASVYQPVTYTSGVSATFEVDFTLNGSAQKSVVTAASLKDAVDKVDSMLRQLGLNAKLTGVKVKV